MRNTWVHDHSPTLKHCWALCSTSLLWGGGRARKSSLAEQRQKKADERKEERETEGENKLRLIWCSVFLRRWDLHICAAVQREKCVSSTDSFLRIFKLNVGASLSLPETAGALLTVARGSGPAPLCSALLWQPSKACLTVSSSAKLLSGGRASWTFPAARANGDVCVCVWAGTELD